MMGSFRFPAVKARHGVMALSLAAVALLPACMLKLRSPDGLVAACQAEVAPPGTYEYIEGPGVPVMMAVEDGTEAGAAAFNACIRSKAATVGLISRPGAANSICPKGAPTIYGGATYCIGTN